MTSRSTSIRILGCGSSGGVPRIGNDWGVCDPKHPRNRRTRCSVLFEQHEPDGHLAGRLLVDTAPDMREQLIAAQVASVDAVIYTHTHADQCHGIDDLRVLAMLKRKQVPVFGMKQTMDELLQRFGYCFRQPDGSPYPAILHDEDPLVPGIWRTIPTETGSIEVLPLDQDHGSVRSLGLRIGNVAYCNDVVSLPDETMAGLEGLDVLVVDALRYTRHPSHANVAEALQWIAQLKPVRAVLTNLHIDLDYETLRCELPENVEPAFDGMVLGCSLSGSD